MNIISFFIIVILFLLGICYLTSKKICIDHLNKAIKKNDYNYVLNSLASPYSRLLLSAYIKDLYKAKALCMKGDMDSTKQFLGNMFQKEYDPKDTMEYLTLYFHSFLLKNDYTFVSSMLPVIKKCNDENFISYHVISYDVIVNGRNDLIKEIQDAIDLKKYSGFALGVVIYMIALQYYRNNALSDALLWFETCLTVLQPYDLYFKEANAYIEELENSECS